MLMRFRIPAIIAACVGALVVMRFAEPYALAPIQSLKTNCFKPVDNKDYESKYYGDKSAHFLTVAHSSQSDPPRSGGNAEHHEVEYDCLVAEYTEKLARFTY
jgi:hypothetical protein